jgi:hypothetical protein
VRRARHACIDRQRLVRGAAGLGHGHERRPVLAQHAYDVSAVLEDRQLTIDRHLHVLGSGRTRAIDFRPVGPDRADEKDHRLRIRHGLERHVQRGNGGRVFQRVARLLRHFQMDLEAVLLGLVGPDGRGGHPGQQQAQHRQRSEA